MVVQTPTSLVVRKPTSEYSVIYPQRFVWLEMNSESQNWSLCPSPGLSILFCFSFVRAKPQWNLSILPVYLENTNVHSRGQSQMLPNIWSSESRSTGHFSRSKQNRAQQPPFQYYPCVFWLYTQSLTKSLWETSLCFWPWLGPLCHLAQSFPENAIAILPRNLTLVYVQSQSQTYSLWKNLLNPCLLSPDLSSNWISFFSKGCHKHHYASISIGNHMLCEGEREVWFSETISSLLSVTQDVETWLFH